MLNLSFSNRFLTTRLFKSFLTCLICFISTVLGSNNLNSADVPLRNKQCPTAHSPIYTSSRIFVSLYVLCVYVAKIIASTWLLRNAFNIIVMVPELYIANLTELHVDKICMLYLVILHTLLTYRLTILALCEYVTCHCISNFMNL